MKYRERFDFTHLSLSLEGKQEGITEKTPSSLNELPRM